jgi:NADH dehydrogenase (ubiquinone) Fe-S protein 1
VLRCYDLVEPSSLGALSKVQLVDQNKGAKASGAPLKKPIQDFYFTDVISRRYLHSLPTSLWNITNDLCFSSPTMARCSAAKATCNPETNFMAQGEPHPQVTYGPQSASA